ncbi:MAG: hypothetical protein WCY85_06645, partial [Sulfurimonas sp.]
MKINQSDVSLFSIYQKSSKIEESEQLHIWNDKEDALKLLRSGDRLELSDKFKNTNQNIDKTNVQERAPEAQMDSKLMSII